MTGPPSMQAHATSKNGGSLPKREELKFLDIWAERTNNDYLCNLAKSDDRVRR